MSNHFSFSYCSWGAQGKITEVVCHSEKALQIAVNRREVGKGEKERYNNLKAKFQKTARRDKKAFLRDQCKETDENNTMAKTTSPGQPSTPTPHDLRMRGNSRQEQECRRH